MGLGGGVGPEDANRDGGSDSNTCQGDSAGISFLAPAAVGRPPGSGQAVGQSWGRAKLKGTLVYVVLPDHPSTPPTPWYF